tara:strand:+ start:43 stop:804 length:762 start_codon:yes stop_codon:yes gene_type:complete
MAKTVTFSVKNLKRKLSLYEETQAKFAGKKTLTKFAKRMKGRDGIVSKKYQSMFKSTVSFTKTSTFSVQDGLKLEIGVKDEKAMGSKKGNPAAKYLYPPIGGGSTEAYGTQFTQLLRNLNYMDKDDYPFAVRSNPLIRIGKNGRVTRATYKNTISALKATKNKSIKGRSKGSKIQDARVVAFKAGESKYKGGIYREQVPSSGKFPSFFRPLFVFKPTPTQAPKQSFNSIITSESRKLIPEMWLDEIQELAKGG